MITCRSCFIQVEKTEKREDFSLPLHALPDEDGEVSAEEHVEHGAADVGDLHGEGLAHHHVERAAHLLVQHVLKAAS